MAEEDNIAVDHILKQETLIDDLGCIAAEYKLLLRIPKKRLNVSNEKQDYRKFYRSNDVDKIAMRHQKDNSLFGYSF